VTGIVRIARIVLLGFCRRLPGHGRRLPRSATQSSLTPKGEKPLHSEQISKLSHGVNNVLTLYLEVHDGIFAQSWWRSIPIPGLFKRIPFDQYETQISKIERILREIESCVRAFYQEARSNEKTYLTVLHQYTDALLKAVIALNPIVAGLRGEKDGIPYDIATYQRDLAVYRTAESGYHALGEEMNRQWGAYSRSDLRKGIGRDRRVDL
jgi:hypothetical protein